MSATGATPTEGSEDQSKERFTRLVTDRAIMLAALVKIRDTYTSIPLDPLHLHICEVANKAIELIGGDKDPQLDFRIATAPSPIARKVVFKLWDAGARNYTTGLHGYFLQFGVDFQELEGGPVQFTTAIIEAEDGNIHILHPSHFKFEEWGM